MAILRGYCKVYWFLYPRLPYDRVLNQYAVASIECRGLSLDDFILKGK